ncbi:arginine--tRNA ligase, partial [Francisella tularensis]|uniref:arginine--tRNA ligase domain-containing protein n=1 Tax=Francisella tularensis TaxID=263 RepID=UPI002381C866
FIDEMISYFQANNFIYEDEGASVIDTNKDGVPPLIVIKKDGGVMYGTTDLATLWQRSKDIDPDEIIYVVDKRQSLHFKQVFSV